MRWTDKQFAKNAKYRCTGNLPCSDRYFDEKHSKIEKIEE